MQCKVVRTVGPTPYKPLTPLPKASANIACGPTGEAMAARPRMTRTASADNTADSPTVKSTRASDEARSQQTIGQVLSRGITRTASATSLSTRQDSFSRMTRTASANNVADLSTVKSTRASDEAMASPAPMGARRGRTASAEGGQESISPLPAARPRMTRTASFNRLSMGGSMRVTAVQQRGNAGRKLPPPCACKRTRARVCVTRWSLPPSLPPPHPSSCTSQPDGLTMGAGIVRMQLLEAFRQSAQKDEDLALVMAMVGGAPATASHSLEVSCSD